MFEIFASISARSLTSHKSANACATFDQFRAYRFKRTGIDIGEYDPASFVSQSQCNRSPQTAPAAHDERRLPCISKVHRYPHLTVIATLSRRR